MSAAGALRRYGDSDESKEAVVSAYLRRNFPESRAASCGRFIVSRDNAVSLRGSSRVDDKGKLHYSTSFRGLNQCGDVKGCMYCARARAIKDADDLRAGVQANLLHGGGSLVVTFTCHHTSDDTYTGVRSAFRDALSSMRSGRPYHELMKKYGVIGPYMAEEETWGARGPHPHEHDLVFCDRPVDPKAFKAELWPLYLAALHKFGLDAEWGVGLHVDASSVAAVEYVSKRGADTSWGGVGEVTGRAYKSSRKGLTFFDMVYLAATDDSDRGRWAAAQVAEYMAYWSSSGRRRSPWSPGLFKKLLGYARGDKEPAGAPVFDKNTGALLQAASDEWVAWQVRRDAREFEARLREGRELVSISSPQWSALLHFGRKHFLLYLGKLVLRGVLDKQRLKPYLEALERRYARVCPVILPQVA